MNLRSYFLEACERLTTGWDLVSFLEYCCRTLIAFLTSATFRTPVVRPPFAPAVQYAYEIFMWFLASFSATVARAPDLLVSVTHKTSVSLWGIFSFANTSFAFLGEVKTIRITPCSTESIIVIAMMLILACANSPST